MFFLSLFTVYLSLLPFYVKLEQLNVNKWTKMNDRVPKERLGSSRLNHVFLKIYLYDPTSKFQE